MNMHEKTPYKFIAGAILSLCSFAISVNTMPVMITGIGKIIGNEINLRLLFGFIFFFQYLSFTIVSLVLGYLSGRGFSAHCKVITLALIISGLCFTGLSILIRFNSTVSTPVVITGLFVTAIVLGGSGGAVEPGVTYLLEKADNSPHKRLMQLSQFFYCIGAVLSPMGVGLLLKRNLVIPDIGMIVGCGILLSGIVCGILFSGDFRQLDLFGKQRPAADDQPAGDSVIIRAKVGVRPLVSASLMMFLYVVIEISLASWIPYQRESISSFDSDTAAFFLAFFWLGLASARIIYTFIKRLNVGAAMLIHAAVLFIALGLLFFSGNNFGALLFLYFLCGFSCGPMWPFIATRAAKTCSSSNHMIYVIAAGSVGASLGPVISSGVIDHFGLHVFFPYLSIAAACLLTVIIYDELSSAKKRLIHNT